jgi:uncharacterized protein YyaL (SSP411 family)
MDRVNRLTSSTSPYLRQHQDNPVDWYPWGEEALTEARRRDVPILLSVGYAACHWCHVMAHESFEDADVAAVMNEHFVNIKVDREERPDIDAVYMEATVALTGQGGWPMTCLLTPTGEPFFAGTYFPREHFLRLLHSAAHAWSTERDGVLAAGQRIVSAIADAPLPGALGSPVPQAADLDAATQVLIEQFDPTNAGFGGAPKFPPSMILEFLLRQVERAGSDTALVAAERTFEVMARGGMYDQLAGGFARYCVDAAWVVPHFEKMLYDNALLLRAYAHWYRLRDVALAGRVVRETAEFLLRDLRVPSGGFASALDADTDGVEGLTYVWTPDQLREVLGADADRAAELFTVTATGTFEHGASTLQLRMDPVDVGWHADVRDRLLAARARRPQPARDDKVVTSWNGLAVAALAEAGLTLDEPRYLTAAIECADFLLAEHLVDGRLRRASRDGAAGGAAGVAEDYGNLADGLLVLHQATADPRWLESAGALLDVAVAHFRDGEGGFFDTGDDAEQLIRRPRDPADNATPSGRSSLATALLTYSALTGSVGHRQLAEQALRAVTAFGTSQPRFLGWGLAAAEALVSGPVQVALVGDTDAELARAAWKHRPPGAVIVSGEPDAAGVPLLAGRALVDGRASAYVCRGMVCDLPVTTVDDLLARF